MEYTFKELKKKCVISVSDGKKLGKITDIKITFPQNCVKSFFAENPFSFCGEKYEIGVCNVQKIGEDAILVKLSNSNNKKCDYSVRESETQAAQAAKSVESFNDEEFDE